MTIYFSAQKPNLKPISINEAEAKEKSLMNVLLDAGLPVASSCHGDGICGKCRIHVLLGSEHLAQESELEKKTKQKNKISSSERLSCQLVIETDITVDAPYW